MKNTDQIDEEPLGSNETKDIEKHIDRYRRERANLRRSFTVACNKFDECDTKDDTSGKELKTLFNKIIDKSDRLFNIDSKINDMSICSEDEFDTIESYRDRFIEIKTKFELFTQTEVEYNSVISQSNKSVLKLPKFNLKEFDLMPRTWVAFWGQFSRIHEDQNLKEEDKFQYLISSLSKNTKAKDIVDSYPPSKENYSKVIQHLKSRFGRQDLLIEVYIRDLLSLVGNRNTTKLSTLYDKLGSYLRALESLGVTSNNYAAMLYPVVESCLPKDILKAWDRFRLNKDCDSNSIENFKEKVLEDLMIFLGNEVEGEEHRSLAEEGFYFKNKKQDSEEFKSEKQNQRINYLDIPSSSALTSFEKNQSKLPNCLFCENKHKSQDCDIATAIPLKERKMIIIRKNCCLVCFKYGHVANACYSKVRCVICRRRHFPVMCPQLGEKDHAHPNTDKNISSLLAEKSSNAIYLKTVMIRIRNKGKVKYVRALLDDGSHRSYIEKRLARELQLSPSSHEVLTQGLFGGVKTEEAVHGEYIVKLEGVKNKYSCEVFLLDQPVICTNLPRVNDPKLIYELECRGIKLSDVGPGEPPLQMLLGADTLGKILTGKTEILESGITAIETKFGWTVLGKYNRKNTVNIVSLSLQNDKKLRKEELFDAYDPILQQSGKYRHIEHQKGKTESMINHCSLHQPVITPYNVPIKISSICQANSKYFGLGTSNRHYNRPSLWIKMLLTIMILGTLNFIANSQRQILQLRLSSSETDKLKFLWWEKEMIILYGFSDEILKKKFMKLITQVDLSSWYFGLKEWWESLSWVEAHRLIFKLTGYNYKKFEEKKIYRIDKT